MARARREPHTLRDPRAEGLRDLLHERAWLGLGLGVRLGLALTLNLTSCTSAPPVATASPPTTRVMRGAPVAKQFEALGRKMYAPLACPRPPLPCPPPPLALLPSLAL